MRSVEKEKASGVGKKKKSFFSQVFFQRAKRSRFSAHPQHGRFSLSHRTRRHTRFQLFPSLIIQGYAHTLYIRLRLITLACVEISNSINAPLSSADVFIVSKFICCIFLRFMFIWLVNQCFVQPEIFMNFQFYLKSDRFALCEMVRFYIQTPDSNLKSDRFI